MDKLLKNSSLNAFAILCKSFILFVTSILIVKQVGLESFGVISLVTAYTGLISYLSSGGLDLGLIKLLTQENFRDKYFLKYYFFKVTYFFIFQKLILLIFFIIIGRMNLNIIQALPKLEIIIFLSFYSFYTVLLTVFGAILKGQGKFLFYLIVEQILFPLLSLVLIYLLTVYLAPETVNVCIAMLISAFLSFCIVFVYVWIDIERLKNRNNENSNQISKPFLELLYESIPISLTNLITSLGVTLTIILTGFYLSDSDVGLIALCQRLSFFAQLALLGLLPFFNTSMGEDLDMNRMQNLEANLKFVVSIAFSWAVCVTIFGGLYSNWIFGVLSVQDPSSHLVFLVLLIGVALSAFSKPLAFLLILAGWTKQNLKIELKSLCVLALSTILMTQFYGVIGAALASTVYYCYLSVIRLISIKQKFNMTFSYFHIATYFVQFVAICIFIYFLQRLDSVLINTFVLIMIYTPIFVIVKKFADKYFKLI